MDKRQIRKFKKEFEKLIKEKGIDNLNDSELIQKSLELEQAMYLYLNKDKQLA